jgi:putative ABC transport system ATP-binding protein
MIELQNVTVQFGSFTALDNVSCSFSADDFILLLGHNGAGKTTLFDVLSGKCKVTSGKILRNGVDITTLPEKKRAPYVSRVFQNTHVGSVSSLSLAENLSLATLKNRVAGLKSLQSVFPNSLVEEVLNPLGLRLEELLHVPIGRLSGGQRQIITIIMATLSHPDILLLDEPTAALDPVSADSVLRFIQSYVSSRKLACLLITHDESRARFLANKTWTMKTGQIISF